MNPDPHVFGRQLLTFYDAYRRDLPWRRAPKASRAPDAYRVWVSEVMLQQTRVDAVTPYYERWMRRFPTLRALAEADLDQVLRAWEGLGYYARARNLHRAAQTVRERFRGEVPADPRELERLPGIGPYTAGAIASIAYGNRTPAVDGNVRRVLARVFDLADPSPATLRDHVAALMPADRPGDFNQALMELGATVCTPRSPACARCPVRDSCLAHTRGTQELRPARRTSKPLPENAVGTAVVLSPAGRVLLVRRPEDGLLGRLWEFPGTTVRTDEAPETAAQRAAGHLLGTAPIVTHAFDPIVHTFSHRRTAYHPFRFRAQAVAGVVATTPRQTTVSSTVLWVTPADLPAFALPVAQRKIAALALSRPEPR